VTIVRTLLNQGLLGAGGERCGRVDDIAIEKTFDRPPRVTALISGPGSKTAHAPAWCRAVSRAIHRLLGLRGRFEPVVIAWEDVDRLGTHVELTRTARELGLDRLNRAVARRYIRHIPGAGA
jgi:hypothetical protein